MVFYIACCTFCFSFLSLAEALIILARKRANLCQPVPNVYEDFIIRSLQTRTTATLVTLLTISTTTKEFPANLLYIYFIVWYKYQWH